MSSESLSATGSPGMIVPSVNSNRTVSWPVMMMFSIRSSSTSGCSRPNPNKASKTAFATAVLLQHRPCPEAGGQALLRLRLQQVDDDGAADFLLSLPIQRTLPIAQLTRSAVPMPAFAAAPPTTSPRPTLLLPRRPARCG